VLGREVTKNANNIFLENLDGPHNIIPPVVCSRFDTTDLVLNTNLKYVHHSTEHNSIISRRSPRYSQLLGFKMTTDPQLKIAYKAK
jgi:hypothetical protein